MKKQLFEYVVIFHEYEKAPETATASRVYKDSKVIIKPTTRLAKTEKDLVFQVTREIPNEYAENPDDIEILVRNF